MKIRRPDRLAYSLVAYLDRVAITPPREHLAHSGKRQTEVLGHLDLPRTDAGHKRSLDGLALGIVNKRRSGPWPALAASGTPLSRGEALQLDNRLTDRGCLPRSLFDRIPVNAAAEHPLQALLE